MSIPKHLRPPVVPYKKRTQGKTPTDRILEHLDKAETSATARAIAERLQLPTKLVKSRLQQLARQGRTRAFRWKGEATAWEPS